METDIVPEEYRDLAAEHALLMAENATRGDVEKLRSEIRELKWLVLAMQPVRRNVNVSFDAADAISRSSYQVVRSL